MHGGGIRRPAGLHRRHGRGEDGGPAGVEVGGSRRDGGCGDGEGGGEGYGGGG